MVGVKFDTETGFSLNLVGKLMLSVSAIFLIVALDLVSTVRVIFFARRRGTRGGTHKPLAR